MEQQLKQQQFYGRQNENINKDGTEYFDLSLSTQLDNQKWKKIYKSDHQIEFIKLQPCTNKLLEQSSNNFIIIRATQYHKYLIMTAELKISQFKGNRITNILQLNSQLLQKGFNNYYFYNIDDAYYIRYKQICWEFQEIQNAEKQIECLENELNRLQNNINFQSLIDCLFEEEKKITKPQNWLNNLISKTDFQYPMIMKIFNVMDIKQKSCLLFLLINVLDEKNNCILFQSHNQNNLYKRQYVKKTQFELNQNQVNSIYQLQQQINGFLILLPEQKQKMLKNAFINFGFDFGKKIFYQFDQEEEDLNKMITSQELKNLTLKQSKKLIESVSIIYYLQEHLILNEDYFNDSVFQVNKKGKLKINFLNSNELNISKNNIQQNLNIQKVTPNRIQQIIKLMALIIEINQLKQLSEEETENLFKLNQIVQYNQQTGLLQIPQIFYVLDQIQFSSNQSKKQ